MSNVTGIVMMVQAEVDELSANPSGFGSFRPAHCGQPKKRNQPIIVLAITQRKSDETRWRDQPERQHVKGVFPMKVLMTGAHLMYVITSVKQFRLAVVKAIGWGGIWRLKGPAASSFLSRRDRRSLIG